MRCICLKTQNEPSNKIILWNPKNCVALLFDGSKHATLEVLYKLLR